MVIMAAPEKQEKSLGITTKREQDFGEWYNQVVVRAELADFSEVKGFMVIRPSGYAIWEQIQEIFNARLKKLGHSNAYFPALIPESFFTREKEHVEGFTPEVFWVTHGGESELENRLALRPTSETIIYDTYSKWVRSYRDLPILLNVWNSVFRYETKATKLFLRVREIIWQEGHTCHASKEEADKEAEQMLGEYKKLIEDNLAIPLLTGKKSEGEKFPGALYTLCIEALMPDGKSLQMGTSHNLGQNFAKAFHIEFLNEKGEKEIAWNTSWGMSVRVIGGLVMVHSDDKGLVLPPNIAARKMVIVPIYFNDQDKAKVLAQAEKIQKEFSSLGAFIDTRDHYSPGWKFNEWELKGIPLRLELGPKDLAAKQAMVVRRDTGKKTAVKLTALKKTIPNMLKEMQEELFKKAKDFLYSSITEVGNWNDFVKAVENKKIAFGYFCERVQCEKEIKEKTTATVRCIPMNQKVQKGKCVSCSQDSKIKAYFAKSY